MIMILSSLGDIMKSRRQSRRYCKLFFWSSLLLLAMLVAVTSGYLLAKSTQSSASIWDFNKIIVKFRSFFSQIAALLFNKFRSGVDVVEDNRIPFWIIAHMVNSVDQIGPMLRNGSNGIEVDISFNDNGFPVESYHGFPCDCGRLCNYRSSFSKVLEYLATVDTNINNLQVVLLDLKLGQLSDESKLVAGETLARLIHENIYINYKPNNIRLVISINHVKDRGLIRSFVRYMQTNELIAILQEYIGFDVGMNDRIDDIIAMWRQLKDDEFREISYAINAWQGDGLTNCLNYGRSTHRLRNALGARDNSTMNGYFKKVYFWTVDMQHQFRHFLRLIGPDAVLTNQPRQLISVLEEDEFKYLYKMATFDDSPFERHEFNQTAYNINDGISSWNRMTFRYQMANSSVTAYVKSFGQNLLSAMRKTMVTLSYGSLLYLDEEQVMLISTMKYQKLLNILLCLACLLVTSAGRHEASVLSKLKNVFSGSSNKTNNEMNNQTSIGTNQDRFKNQQQAGYDYNKDQQNYGNKSANNNMNDNYQLYSDTQGTRDGDTRVPFWNIAHMVNSIEQVNQMLGNGSNGIEIDVSFNDMGHPIESYHGFPCDCGRHCHYRDDFVQMIRHIAQICVPPASCNLQLVLFDLKLSKLDEQKKIVAGEALANILHENLYNKYAQVVKNNRQISGGSQQQGLPGNQKQNSYQNQDQFTPQDSSPYLKDKYSAAQSISSSNYNNKQEKQLFSPSPPASARFDRSDVGKPPIRVVISINYVNDSSLIKSFMKYVQVNKLESMRKLVGFDVGMNDKLTNISSMWQQLNGLTRNVWQGDGLTNCVNLVRPTDRLRDAISMRNEQGPFRKVYYWTVDVLYQLRSILRLGPDAVLTNQPQRILQVLDEPEFKQRYRLATPFDDPFAQYWIEPTASHMSIPTAEDAKETIENVKNTSMNFIKTLPDGVSAAFKKVLSSASSKINNQ